MRTLAGLLVCTFGVAPTTHAQQTRTANDSVYSDAQAARGRTLYQTKCAKCHGDTLEGRTAPALAGSDFVGVWGAQPLSELASKIRNTMPGDDPGKLKPAETSDLVAFMLQAGKFPSGKSDLGADEAVLKSIVIAVAKPQTSAPATAHGPEFPPMGNLAQIMRGILFPSSNIIFNVQLHDPGAPAKPGVDGTTPFSWTDWGAGIYSGWQIIDYAAVAIADTAPLMLTPGRRCENGKPVPVDRPDWIKFTQELADAGRAAYKASQTRNQQAVSDATNQLADSCAHCHGVYRDKRGGRPGTPAASSGKCTP